MSYKPIRVRTIYQPLVGLASTQYSNGTSTTPTSFDYWEYYSYMEDQNNPIDKKNGKRPVGKCKHVKVAASNILPATSYVQADGLGVGMINHARQILGRERPYGPSLLNEGTFPGWSQLSDSDFAHTPTYRNLCLSAFTKQSQQVPSKTSLINFILELKDLKPLTKAFAKIPQHLKAGTLRQAVSKPARNARGLPKKVASAGVDTFLSWNFGWAPFISDLMTFASIGETVTKRLNYLRETRGKETVVHFVKEDCYQHPGVGQVVYVRDDTSDVYQRVVLRSYTCDFYSTWNLLQNIEGLDDTWAGLRATIAALGMNNPAKIVWNAIPFSFMADWIGPFGSWLERAAVQPFYGEWDISRVTSSYRERYVFDFLFTGKRGGTDGVEFTVTVDKYNRLDGLPFSLGAIDFSQLTDTQQKLALSIPLARVLK